MVVAGESVALFPGATLVVDVDRFDHAAAAALSGDAGRAADAVALYAGDLLPQDLYEAWTEEARETRRLTYLQLLRTLGRWEQVLAADPLEEQAHLRLVGEHLRRGDRSAAVTLLDRMDTVWWRDLGLDPGEAARELRAEAEAHPAALYDWGAGPRATGRDGGDRRVAPARGLRGRPARRRRRAGGEDRRRAGHLLAPGGSPPRGPEVGGGVAGAGGGARDLRHLSYSLCMVAGTYMGDPQRYQVGLRLCEEASSSPARWGNAR